MFSKTYDNFFNIYRFLIAYTRSKRQVFYRPLLTREDGNENDERFHEVIESWLGLSLLLRWRLRFRKTALRTTKEEAKRRAASQKLFIQLNVNDVFEWGRFVEEWWVLKSVTSYWIISVIEFFEVQIIEFTSLFTLSFFSLVFLFLIF